MRPVILLLTIYFLWFSNFARAFTVEGLVIPPYIMQSEEGEVSGIIVDIVYELADRLDWEVTFEISNWARAYRNVTSHKSDALMPAIKTPDRLEWLFFPDAPLITVDMHLVKHVEHQIQFDGNLDELKELEVGRIRDAKVTPEFDQAVSDGRIQIVERNSLSQLVQGVAAKRIDLIAFDWRLIQWQAKELQLRDRIERVHPPLGKVPAYLAFSNRRFTESQIKQVSETLSKMHEEGVLQRIEAKYFFN